MIILRCQLTGFTNVREIVEMETILKAYIDEAIEVEKAGLKVNFKKTTEFKFRNADATQETLINGMTRVLELARRHLAPQFLDHDAKYSILAHQLRVFRFGW